MLRVNSNRCICLLSILADNPELLPMQRSFTSSKDSNLPPAVWALLCRALQVQALEFTQDSGRHLGASEQEPTFETGLKTEADTQAP